VTHEVGENEDRNEVKAVRHCPHCRQPIAVICPDHPDRRAPPPVTVPTVPRAGDGQQGHGVRMRLPAIMATNRFDLRRSRCHDRTSTTRRRPMATYRYRCETDGPRDVVRPIGTAEDTLGCPECGAAMPRVFAVPMLVLGCASARSLIERAERTRVHPDVVSAPSPASGRLAAPAANPAWSRLPRP